MNKWLKILLIGLVLGLVSAFIIYKIMYRPVKSIESYAVNLSIDAGAMIDEFIKDPQNGNEKYLEKVIEVSGVVHKIEKSDSSITILFDDGKDYIISLSVNENNTKKAEALKVGDLTALVGQYNGYIEGDKSFMFPGTIQISRCYFK